MSIGTNPETATTKMSRRKLLTLLGAGAAAPFAVPPIYHWLTDPEPQKVPEEKLTRRQWDARDLENEVYTGLASDWQKLAVWPGILVVSSTAKIFKTPDFKTGERREWPGQPSAKLLVQRPAFVMQSLQANDSSSYFKAGITPAALCFYMPKSNRVGYLNFENERDHILTAMRAGTENFSPNGSNLTADIVSLGSREANYGFDTRYSYLDGLYWPYTEDEHGVSKVCARAAMEPNWEDVSLDLRDYNGITNSYYNRLQLPEDLIND